MKRVICLYRVSTLGQVDHDDIPMQRLACHEYAATHPDWEIVDEISEKGVSGYKVSTNARDAIVEIKKRAVTHQFDVLLVFMFDRLGRREDETPFVVQWFWFIKAPKALPATPNQFLVFKEAIAPIALVIYPAST